jgi:putative hemolysin
MSEFEIKITADPAEIEEAQRLRFQVFNLQMQKGLKSSYARQLDVDEFDEVCEHLIVRDRTSREVVGTYRLMRGVKARTHSGFYSEKEFNLSTIKSLDGELLEHLAFMRPQRFCDRTLIFLLWRYERRSTSQSSQRSNVSDLRIRRG